MARIGFRYKSFDETEAEGQVPAMDMTLAEVEKRLLMAQAFLLTNAFSKMGDKGKAKKIKDVEFYSKLAAKLS